jgi:hypothetical protein
MDRRVAGVLFAACCLGFAAPPSNGQQAPQAFSDAFVIVKPYNGAADVAVTYSRAVPHAKVKEQLTRLARAFGMTFTPPKVSTEEFFTSAQFGKRVSLGKQTSAETEMTGASVTRANGFVLQPFAEAFKDLDRFDVMFMTGTWPEFQGLRAFEHPALSVALRNANGPYRYHFEIKDRAAALPNLPLLHTEAPPQPAPKKVSRRAASDYMPVMLIAAGSGLAVFLGLRLISLRRAPARGDRSAGGYSSRPQPAPNRKD